LLKANPQLSSLITEVIGDKWIKQPHSLIKLQEYVKDPSFLQGLKTVKQQRKKLLADIIQEQTGIKIDSNSIFDVQVKRLHAYKRQLLNVLHIMYLYNRLKEDPNFQIVPRTFIFGAKASPGYYYAKKVIKLINSVADVVNNDPQTSPFLKVVFLENYRVSLAEYIFPAADVSEQISTASKEASGTGNMKFMMNGALTLGTMDGANVEISEAVGKDNVFIFGLKAEEVLSYQQNGGYRAYDYYHHDKRIRQVLEQLTNGFLPDTYDLFEPIYDSLLMQNDEYYVLRDFDSYVTAQQKVNEAYRNENKWLQMSATNIAHSGFFSSDRTIEEYASDIWGIHSTKNLLNQ
jgi:starch phosphorylase